MLCQQQPEQLFWTIKMISSQINGASCMLFNVKKWIPRFDYL